MERDPALELPAEIWAHIMRGTTPKESAAVGLAGDAHTASQVAREKLVNDERIVLIRKEFKGVQAIYRNLCTTPRMNPVDRLPVEEIQRLYLGLALRRQCPWLLEEAVLGMIRFAFSPLPYCLPPTWKRETNVRDFQACQYITIRILTTKDDGRRLVCVAVRPNLDWGSRVPYELMNIFTNFGFAAEVVKTEKKT